mmetsp:Transcript_175964/g.564247  ORF Transcript_175964/g.564247 Transcript_175964/m.564247 type:complete len:250 (+) Transcript_175964:684-1433(+)
MEGSSQGDCLGRRLRQTFSEGAQASSGSALCGGSGSLQRVSIDQWCDVPQRVRVQDESERRGLELCNAPQEHQFVRFSAVVVHAEPGEPLRGILGRGLDRKCALHRHPWLRCRSGEGRLEGSPQVEGCRVGNHRTPGIEVGVESVAPKHGDEVPRSAPQLLQPHTRLRCRRTAQHRPHRLHIALAWCVGGCPCACICIECAGVQLLLSVRHRPPSRCPPRNSHPRFAPRAVLGHGAPVVAMLWRLLPLL